MSRITTPVLLAVFGAGCVGSLEYEAPPAGGDAGGATADPADPREMFAATVQPALARCGGAACHTGTGSPLKFLGTDDPADDYASITAFPSVTGDFEPKLASLLLKIDPGTHNGITYSAEQRAAISDWLAAEKVARSAGDGDSGGGEVEPVADALAAWSGCMTKANWDAAQMGTWADKLTADGDACATCHNDGAYRFNTNDENDQMFQLNRYPLYIIGFFTVGVATDGSETVVPAHDKLVRMGDGSTLHPRYGTGAGDLHFGYMADFYSRTFEVQAAGLCGPPVTP